MSASVQELFRNPPAVFRTAPLWVWNDEMTKEQIERQLSEMSSHGFGGVFIHPRPGLITEYLSDDWFGMWTYALHCAERLGLKVYIYDENSYPSGFAGGHVPSELPDCVASSVRLRIVDNSAARKEERASAWLANRKLIKAFACEPANGGTAKYKLLRDVTLLPEQQWGEASPVTIVLESMPAETNAWLGGFAYVDLLRPEVADAFLRSTYEAYHERYGDRFGASIPAIFTDEPAIPGSTVYSREKDHLPFSYWFAAEFQQINGYSLPDRLPCLFLDVEDDGWSIPAVKVRYDYYSTMRALFVDNFIKPIANWCEARGVAWTGHYMENYWPFAAAGMPSPAVMSYYEYMHWPAIDMLMAHLLRDRPADPLLLTIKEVSSAANQFERPRVLCESYGAGGWDSTFEDYKRIGDWLLVHGVNFINPHYTSGTIVGARKRDHPQSFDWRQPWWDDYKEAADYFGRLCCLLSQGAAHHRILVLHPTTTGFLVARSEERGDLMSVAEPIANPDMTAYMEMLQYLSDRQWDYDLGDEFIMERHGRTSGKQFIVASRAYDIVVASGDMKNMKQSTVGLLQQFLSGGGTVVAAGTPGPYVDAVESADAFAALAMHENWVAVRGLEALEDELDKRLERRLTGSAPWPAGVAHLRRTLDDGRSVYFIVNHSGAFFHTGMELEGARLEKWDPWTGDAAPVSAAPKAGRLFCELSLEPNESVVLVAEAGAEAEARRQPAAFAVAGMDSSGEEPEYTALTVAPHRIEAEEDNVLLLDYCDLQADGRTWTNMNAAAAGQQLFKQRGFDGNPWDNAVQFKRRLLDRNRFGDGSGFRVSYRFVWNGGAKPERMLLAAERARFYRLLVNGTEILWSEGEAWLDHHIGTADIREYVQHGVNTVTLVAERFDVRLELEAVYIKGAFSVHNVDDRWIADVPGKVAPGTWISQGYPFYPGAFRYAYRFEVPEGASNVVAVVGEYTGTAASLYVNGERAGLLGVGRGRRVDISRRVSAGWNEVVVRVCGSFKNLLGPHHLNTPVRGRAWPGHWREAPTFGRPPASQYDLIEYGLASALTVKVGNTSRKT